LSSFSSPALQLQLQLKLQLKHQLQLQVSRSPAPAPAPGPAPTPSPALQLQLQLSSLPTPAPAQEIELVGGSGPHEGNIMLNGQPVCDSNNSPGNALVVCRQLGYLGGHATWGSHFGEVSGDFAMVSVNCTGTEEALWRCPPDTEHYCETGGKYDGMGVTCSNSRKECDCLGV